MIKSAAFLVSFLALAALVQIERAKSTHKKAVEFGTVTVVSVGDTYATVKNQEGEPKRVWIGDKAPLPNSKWTLRGEPGGMYYLDKPAQ